MENHPKKGKQRFSDNFYNSITYCGVVLSVLVLVCEVFLFAIDIFVRPASVYLGIITYILLPPFLIIGLILIPIGARRKQHRVHDGLEKKHPKHIVIDPTSPTHQNAVLVFMIGTAILLMMTAIGCYKAYNFTESQRFCGVTCHGIMKPEYTEYLQSPHARVKCVDCHIGSGAGWYVRYKMAGVKMLIKAIDGSYSRPTPAPVDSMRPASETCEQCHWPGKSFSAIQLKKTYYADDPSQTPPWTIKILMRTGGSQKGEYGIHAHMYYDQDIYYVPEDAKRQKISWIKTVSKDGKVKIFTTSDSPYKEIAPPASKIRKMDCIDCHNRPTHRFQAPEVLINRALADGFISASIPMVKSKAVDALAGEYKNSSEAIEKIGSSLKEYYSKKQAAYYADHQATVEQAIRYVIFLYQGNFFPEMKSRWDAYPDNIGHMISLGCFRCHDDEHKAKTGEVISRNCTLCHTITEQGSGATVQKSTDGLPFQHPFQGDDDSWKGANCSDCHTGS